MKAQRSRLEIPDITLYYTHPGLQIRFFAWEDICTTKTPSWSDKTKLWSDITRIEFYILKITQPYHFLASVCLRFRKAHKNVSRSAFQ